MSKRPEMPQLTTREQPHDLSQVQHLLRNLSDTTTVAGLAEPNESAPGSANRSDPYELSNLTKNQLQVWVAQALLPEVPLYNQATASTISGEIDSAHFQKAFQTLVSSSDDLRTVLEELDGVPTQRVLHPFPFCMEYVDFSLQQGAGAVAQRWMTERCQVPFHLGERLFDAALIRVGAKEFVWYLNIHHLICDGWSFELIHRLMADLYRRSLQGTLPETVKIPPFQNYLAHEREYRNSPRYRRIETYWKKWLAQPNEPLSFYGKTSVGQTTQVRRHSLDLGLERTKKIKALRFPQGSTVGTEAASLVNLFGALLIGYLHCLNGRQSYSIGIPFHNRRSKAFKETIGFFSEVLPIRVAIDEEETFLSLIGKFKAQVLETMRYGSYALANPYPKKAYEVILNYHVASFNDFNGMPVRPEWIHTGHGYDSLAVQIHDFGSSGHLVLDFDFHGDVFTQEQSAHAVSHFLNLLDAFLADPTQRLRQMSLLSSGERQRILIEWNNTATPYPHEQCVQQLFEAQVERTPDAIAVSFEDKQLTYRELNARANQVAHHLRSLGVGPEALVGICMERSVEMVVGLLGILKAGGAYVPLDPNYPQRWLTFALEDCQPGVLLRLQRSLPNLSPNKAKIVCLDSEWTIIAREGQENPVGKASPGNLAYVIYTSGSTGRPKGVEVPHRAFANFTMAACDAFSLAPSDRVLQFASVSFDTAVEEMFPSLVRGATVVLRTEDMLESVSVFIQKCRDWNVTVVDLPTVYWHELTEKLCTENLALPEQLRLVIIGGEKALGERLKQWQRHVGERVRLLNSYGPTEATVVATLCEPTGTAGESGLVPEVPIGRPIPNVQTYVLDQYLNPVPVGVCGELHIGGVGLARGYLNRPELTAEKFIRNPFSDKPGARLYRTGDLVRYLPDGNLEFVGRLDQQVKILGFRVELGEIEAILTEHPAVREGVVVVREDGFSEKRLVAYVVPQSGATLAVTDLRNFLRGRLPDYMVPVDFVSLEFLPSTPSGKVDRQALPVPGNLRQEPRSDLQPPRTPTEKVLAGIWCSVLGLEQVGIHDNFFELGGHSLLATQVLSRLREVFPMRISLRVFFEAPTIADLASCIDEELQRGRRAEEASPITPARRDGALPLSSSQGRMWFLHQLAPESAVYNIAVPLRLTGPLNKAALERSVNEVVHRHESLRTVFQNVDGRPVQVIAAALEVAMQEVDLRMAPEDERLQKARRLLTEEARRPFDLERGPLFRLLLVQLSEQDHLLLLTIHHVISDQWSLGIIGREITSFYNSFCNALSPSIDLSHIEYADFAVWQGQRLSGELFEAQISYWKKQLAGLKVLELPNDHHRPAVQTFHGAHVTLDLPRPLIEGLMKLSVREGVSLYMTLLAAFKTLLYRYSGQQDIAIGSPIANRNWLAIEGIVGTFVNTLVLRTDLSGNPTFRELLARVREVTLAAFDHQELPFERLVEELQPQRDLSRPPLVSVLFNLQNAPIRGVNLQGLSWTPFEIDAWAAQFDISLTIDIEVTQKMMVAYNTDLYDAATAVRMLSHYLKLLEAIVAGPEGRISELEILPEAERRQLLVDWNDTKRDYAKDKFFHQLFEMQVERTPDAIAVSFEDKQLTYRELNARANQVAHYLRSMGVGPEVLVGIFMERSVEMVVGLLGIMKAGGAYVPLNPDHPLQRISFMLEDSEAAVLLTQERLVQFLPDYAAPLVCLDREWDAIALHGLENPSPSAAPDNLAYVLYTSGSTGKPKGVEIRHKALVNVFESMRIEPGLTDRDVLLSVTTISFDIAALELYLPLMVGGRVVLASRDVAADGTRLMNLLESSKTTVMQATPATWRLLLQAGWQGTRGLKILCGGEALSPDLAEALMARGTSMWNLYGPTETTIWSTVWKVELGEERLSIGRPMANTRLYILDTNLQPVPIGIPGELYIGGEGLARGYLKRPELTAEKFIPDPFGKEVGARLFRSGDLASYLPNGNLIFYGRTDNQVKLHGFRIELGEIEAALTQHPAVRESVVMAREDAPADRSPSRGADKRLVAYVVLHPGQVAAVSELRSFLEQKLPAYMVPSAFMFLEALPLTLNGKVDRRAFPAPNQTRTELEKSFVAPRDVLELQLTKIWHEILDVKPIGVRDNFFELGGHSLLAVRLFAQIEKTFGKHLPLAALFQAPTVEQLATIIRQEGWSAPWSSLVPLQPSGSKPPFFWVHGESSNVLLSRYLGPDQPLYGLEHQSQDGERALYTRVEDIATHYLKEIRTVQSEGPYFLGGYCFGAVVAFEMARQLQKQGQEVALLVLLEPASPSNGKLSPPITPNIMLFGDKIHRHLHNLALHGPQEKLTYILERLRGKIKERMTEVKRIGEKIVCKIYLGIGLPLPPSLRSFYILGVYDQAIRSYVPQIYPGRVILFKAEAISYNPQARWSELAGGEIEFYEVPGDHLDTLEEPHLQVWAEQLRALLQKAQATKSCRQTSVGPDLQIPDFNVQRGHR